MLPARSRLTAAADFASVVRRGMKSGRSTVVAHVASGNVQNPRIGFVVSKSVGNAVARNKVKRRLRGIASELLSELPLQTQLVLRAQPAAARAPYPVLESDVKAAVTSAISRGRR